MNTWGKIMMGMALVASSMAADGAQREAGAASGPAVAVDIEYTPNEGGHYVLDSYGRVTTFGNAPYYGGSPALRDDESAVSISPTPSGLGYWIFTDQGRVFTYGDAAFLGDLDDIALAGPILDSVPTPSGDGYYMLGDDGGIFALGDAGFFGSIPGVLPPGTQLAGKIVGLAPTPTSQGYWLVGEDGGMFAFGDAGFFGSIPGVLPPGTQLDKPVVGMVPQGQGYLMVAADGGIFSFGQSAFHGSIPGLADPTSRVQSSSQEIVAVMVKADNSGYMMLGRDGRVWPFGTTQALGTPDLTIPANPGNSVNCTDFTTQVEAQRWHDRYFPFYGDIGGLDSDGDGEVCESLASSPAQALTSSDGALTINVPEGAAPPGVTVTIEPAPPAAFGPNQIGPAYRMGPDGTTFTKPVTISLRVESLPANVRPQSLQIGLLSSGDLTGLSTSIAAHPDGGWTLTSATSHFTDVGVLPDSLPLDPGLMSLSCTRNGGDPFDCTQGPLLFDLDDEVEITRDGGLAGSGPVSLSVTGYGVAANGQTGFRCDEVGAGFVTAAAASVPDDLPVTPFTHLMVGCKLPSMTSMQFVTSPAPGVSPNSPTIDSTFIGRTADSGFIVGLQPGAPTGPGAFSALFLSNPDTGGFDALTSRGDKHSGPTLNAVGSDVFLDQNGFAPPSGYAVGSTSRFVTFGLPTEAGNRRIERVESTANGFEAVTFGYSSDRTLTGLLGTQSGEAGPTCAPTTRDACIQGGRFMVNVGFRADGERSPADVVDPGLAGSLFTFGGDEVDMVVRMLDGCQTTGSYWLFASAASDVPFDLTVTDTATGDSKTYGHDFGPAPAILDTAAFASCP